GFSGPKAGGRGHRLTTWDLASGERLGQGKAADDLLSTFSADGTLLAGHQGAGIVVREVATGKEILRLAVPAGADNFWSPLAFSPSGRVLATVTSKRVTDGKARHVSYIIRAWEVASGKELWNSPTPRWGRAMAFAPDGKTLAWAGNDVLA